jgi:2-(1,2-epoxy-1,2-dihydrophenyl)acetyl-CoA isomerase
MDGVENDITEPGLLRERAGGVVTLRFNRPRQRNAFDWPVRHLLIDALGAASADPDVRVVVITGDRVAFSSGGDLGEMSPGAEDTPDKLAAGLTITELISTMPKPVVAAVQGHAAGAAFGIAMACDLVFAADNALFSPSFALIGLSTDLSASYWLPRALGLPRAKDILLSGRPLDAAAAYDAGIVSAVWPVDEFESRLAERVEELAAGPTRAFAAIKRLTNDSFARTLREQTAEEIREQVELVSSADHAEGVAAFLERRSPRFEGR